MKYILTLCILFISITSANAQTNEKAEIKKVFEEYKSAILNDQAEDALNAIDNKTKIYYQNILSEVKTADSSKIARMSMIDKVTVLGIRSKGTKKEILDMQGSDAFLFAIRNGMVGKNSVINNSVGEITINKNFAKGELLVQGKKSPVFFHFYKENEGWKLNLTELFTLGNISIKQLLKDSGKSENEFLMEILSAMSGKTLSYDIWQPIE